jgi:hypothetical protein
MNENTTDYYCLPAAFNTENAHGRRPPRSIRGFERINAAISWGERWVQRMDFIPPESPSNLAEAKRKTIKTKLGKKLLIIEVE